MEHSQTNAVIKISDSYWNEHGLKFLKNQHSFENQLSEFLKTVNIPDDIVRIEIPSVCISEINTFQKFYMNYMQEIILISVFMNN